jgi:sugar phosphate isomerase/epimerase
MSFLLSAFGDEIAEDLETQLAVLNDLNIPRLDLRGAWGQNVRYFSDETVQKIKTLCETHHVTVGCIGSPIGKTPILEPISEVIPVLTRIMEIAKMLGTRNIRIFSFYPPDTSSNTAYDQYVGQSAERLAALTREAEREDMLLLLENEKDIVTDTPERCEAVLKAVNSPHLRFIWDPANFVQVGVADQITRYWELLLPYLAYVHIKDARLADGKVTPAGEGDGQVAELIAKLREIGYDDQNGVLALEPHLAIAGHSSGFSGTDGMKTAVTALRTLLN